MLCNRIEELILLTDLKDFTPEERNIISEHIKTCSECREKAEQMNDYHTHIRSIRKTEPVLTNSAELTQSIMDEINKAEDAGKKTILKPRQFLLKSFRQIAASILLISITSFYIQQKIYVNKSMATLEKLYNRPVQKNTSNDNFNECKDFSEQQIKILLATDNEFAEAMSQLAIKASYRNLEKSASSICMQTYNGFEKAGPEQKKQIILDFIKTNLNKVQ